MLDAGLQRRAGWSKVRRGVLENAWKNYIPRGYSRHKRRTVLENATKKKPVSAKPSNRPGLLPCLIDALTGAFRTGVRQARTSCRASKGSGENLDLQIYQLSVRELGRFLHIAEGRCPKLSREDGQMRRINKPTLLWEPLMVTLDGGCYGESASPSGPRNCCLVDPGLRTKSCSVLAFSRDASQTLIFFLHVSLEFSRAPLV